MLLKHSNVKVDVVSNELVRPLPFNDTPFDHGPPAVQLLALVEFHVRVERPP